MKCLWDSFSIILSSMPTSSKWSLSLRFRTKTLYIPLFSPICAICSKHFILLDLIIRIIFSEVYRSSAPRHVDFSIPLLPLSFRQKHTTQHPILEHPQPKCLLPCEKKGSCLNKTTGKIIDVHIYIFILLDSKIEGKGFCTKR
jgi:hypothetical protein